MGQTVLTEAAAFHLAEPLHQPPLLQPGASVPLNREWKKSNQVLDSLEHPNALEHWKS